MKNLSNLEIAKSIIHKRKEKGLTQKQVAEKINVSERQYQKLEAGTCSILSTSFNTGMKICKILELDPYIVSESNEE